MKMMKAVLRGEFTALKAYIKTGEISHYPPNDTPGSSRTSRNDTPKGADGKKQSDSGLK